MEPIKVGVIGVGRGSSMMSYARSADNAQLVAICDKWEKGLEQKSAQWGDSVAYYTDYNSFLKHDMDVVVLANYADEHAPFAIKAMEQGKHVISEVLPCKNMAEAVALVECTEQTGKRYFYLENYCYMGAPREMRRLYREGKLGEFEYGEGEYFHNCEPIWTDITYGDKNHWRNGMHAFFYCTHSMGPLIHITGLRPIRVCGFEGIHNERMARIGARSGSFGIEMVTLENGSIIKSGHGTGISRNSVWYTIYGSKGRMESAREDAAGAHGNRRIYLNLDGETEGLTYLPGSPVPEAEKSGHGGSDYLAMWNCMEALQGNPKADIIDVYEAMDMYLPGMFAYFSVLEGGITVNIPNLRNKEDREKYRNDTRCVETGEIPSYSKGDIQIPDEIYDARRREWEEKH